MIIIINCINTIYDFIMYTKYFIYFNFFLLIATNNFIYYKLFNKSNYYLIKALYYSINLNGCVLIKFVQWINNNSEMLDINNSYTKLFNNFYENNTFHSLNYTKKIFKQDFLHDFDDIIEIDDTYKIKSGSIAQVYKAKFKNNMNNTMHENDYDDLNGPIAVKVVHPEIKYQLLFPINFVYFYKFLINNISFLKKYDTIFNFQSFFENLKLQLNMKNEYANMEYFYNYYSNNEYIDIPCPLYSSKNMLFMKFIDGDLLDNINVSEFEKQKIILLFSLFLKDLYFFSDYFHCDLHDYNWKVTKYNDFYKLIIYDFGYIIKNDDNIKKYCKNFILFSEINNIEGFTDIIYNCITNINIEKNIFINIFKQYLSKFVPYTDDNIKQIYKFCYDNNYKLKDRFLEIFISIILVRKNSIKYLVNKTNKYNYNFITQQNIAYVILCEKYDIFNNVKEHIKNDYINNAKLRNDYVYENDYYELLNNKQENIDI